MEERKDEAGPTSRLGPDPPLFPAALRRLGRGRGTVTGLAKRCLLWFGLGGKAGSVGEKRGCGELKERLAQLDLLRNSNGNNKNGGIKILPYATENLTEERKVSRHEVHPIAVQVKE